MKFDKYDFKTILNDNKRIILYSNTFQSFKCIGYCLIFNKKQNLSLIEKYAKFEKMKN